MRYRTLAPEAQPSSRSQSAFPGRALAAAKRRAAGGPNADHVLSRLNTSHVGGATHEQSLDAIAGDLDDRNLPTARHHDFADERDTLDVVEDESCQGHEWMSTGEPLCTDGAL